MLCKVDNLVLNQSAAVSLAGFLQRLGFPVRCLQHPASAPDVYQSIKLANFQAFNNILGLVLQDLFEFYGFQVECDFEFFELLAVLKLLLGHPLIQKLINLRFPSLVDFFLLLN